MFLSYIHVHHVYRKASKYHLVMASICVGLYNFINILEFNQNTFNEKRTHRQHLKKG